MQFVRGMGRSVRHKLRESRTKILRSLGVLKGDWSTALPAEASFWEKALADPEHCWVLEEFRHRTDPESELQPELRDLLDAHPGSVIRILDVGAGPLTRVGKKWPGRTVEIVPVDPLADAYSALLQRLNIQAPVRTFHGHGERLLEQFGEDQFDLAYASNALDHSYDPLLAINQMFAVVKPGKFVYLWHFANEGLVSGYSGLHQWNFDVRGDDFIISDGRKEISLANEFGGRGRLLCEQTYAFKTRAVIAKIQKADRK